MAHGPVRLLDEFRRWITFDGRRAQYNGEFIFEAPAAASSPPAFYYDCCDGYYGGGSCEFVTLLHLFYDCGGGVLAACSAVQLC